MAKTSCSTLYKYSTNEFTEFLQVHAKEIASHFPAEYQQDVYRACHPDLKTKRNLSSADSIDYTKFDPKAVLQNFITKGKAIIEDKTYEIKNEKNETILKIHSKDYLLHLNILILVFIQRGAVLGKILKKIESQWVAPLIAIGNYYNCIKPAKGTKLGKSDITLPRLAAALPQVACYFLMRNCGKQYFSMDIVEKLAGVSVPKAMQTNIFPGLIPKASTYDEMLNFSHVYNYQLDLVLYSKTKKTFDLRISEVKTYTMTARNSALTSDRSRLCFLHMLGLAKTDGDLIPQVKLIVDASTFVWKCFNDSDSHNEAMALIEKKIKAQSSVTIALQTPLVKHFSIFSSTCEEDRKYLLEECKGGADRSLKEFSTGIASTFAGHDTTTIRVIFGMVDLFNENVTLTDFWHVLDIAKESNVELDLFMFMHALLMKFNRASCAYFILQLEENDYGKTAMGFAEYCNWYVEAAKCGFGKTGLTVLASFQPGEKTALIKRLYERGFQVFKV